MDLNSVLILSLSKDELVEGLMKRTDVAVTSPYHRG